MMILIVILVSYFKSQQPNCYVGLGDLLPEGRGDCTLWSWLSGDRDHGGHDGPQVIFRMALLLCIIMIPTLIQGTLGGDPQQGEPGEPQRRSQGGLGECFLWFSH